MEFRVLSRGDGVPSKGKSQVYLEIDHWNDYSFVTMFHISMHDNSGAFHNLGEVKIAFKGQTTPIATYQKLEKKFQSLDDSFFSVGQSSDYYRKLAKLPNDEGILVLQALQDVVLEINKVDELDAEDVFGMSLLRDTSLSLIKGQYARILRGDRSLKNYSFKYSSPNSKALAGCELSFDVKAKSTPRTNIHSVIGRNGVGKTTLLNGMINAIICKNDTQARFIDCEYDDEREVDKDYFSSLVSVSFSAFDPFSPPPDQPDRNKGICYFYIGLKDKDDPKKHKTIEDLHGDMANALINCFYQSDKKKRWFDAIAKLGTDENFEVLNLPKFEEDYSKLRRRSGSKKLDTDAFRDKYLEKIQPKLTQMSSGHAIVLLTITKLVAAVSEKTLVLIDEPEGHLHPPLLSAFLRALSDLLKEQNGLAIIATHSPVVLQEVPKSCVWKINRFGDSFEYTRVEKETFGENVGILTREIFGLEVIKSGFHDLLVKSVDTGRSYEEIVKSYEGQLGLEARAILKALTVNNDRSAKHDKNG
ncbi:MAG: AAA family ATPase [Neptuniibacter sp.]